MKSGEKLSEDMYALKLDPQGEGIEAPDKPVDPEPTNASISSDPQQLQNKKIKLSSEDTKIVNLEKSNEDRRENAPLSSTSTASSPGEVDSLNCANRGPEHLDAENEAVRSICLPLKIISLKYFSSRTSLWIL